MLCSISTGKSGSKWLDRLRSSKGFPAGNDLDLEQFLSHHHDPNLSNSPDTELPDADIGPKLEKRVLDRNQTATETPRENGETEWLGIMTNVIAELFHMGESDDFPRIHGKKISRKQSNPRICVLSTSSNVETVPSSGENSCAEIKETSDQLRLMKEENVDFDVGSVDVEEDEKSHGDLSGFSRTEVTVIDSSSPSWKCEKLLFRRKNVWRVREKKSRSTNIGVKKRKVNSLEEEAACGEKKPKRCNSSKDANREEHMTMPSNNVHLQSNKMIEGREEIPAVVRFPRKSKKCGSSLVHVKRVPTGKKNGTNIPRPV